MCKTVCVFLKACILVTVLHVSLPGEPARAVETPTQRDQRMAWWREARFGMFIHWGLYSIAAGRFAGQDVQGGASWTLFTTKTPLATYTPLIEQFNPVKFDADAWVSLAKEAGMKYMVLTSKHHEGFCLFDAAQTDFDVMSSPFKRDILRELAAAARRQGMRLGWYYSKHHPKIIINNRLDAARLGMGSMHGDNSPGDFGTPEEEIPPSGLGDVDWETCMTMNGTWGYKRQGHNWKSTETLIRNLVDIASKGGKYILELADQHLVGQTHNTGDWFEPATDNAGAVAIPQPGRYTLAIRLDKENTGPIMDLQKVVLKPTAADQAPQTPSAEGYVPGPVDAAGRPLIKKHGIIVAWPIGECTHFVFRGRLYRYEAMHRGRTKLDYDYSRIVDYETGKVFPPFAKGVYIFGSAFVDNDTVYVSVSKWVNAAVAQDEVHIFASSDLENWISWRAFSQPGKEICNTSICKAKDKYVMMYEIGASPEAGQRYSARFAISADLKTWKVTPPQCVYDKSRYSAPHALRYLDGYFYNFYLVASPVFEMHVARSADLVHWEPSPLNPVFTPSPEDRIVYNPSLTAAEKERVAKYKNINNSDIDFCYFDGKLIFNYCTGDQATEGHLGEAVYEGTLEQFLTGWFPQKPFAPFQFLD